MAGDTEELLKRLEREIELAANALDRDHDEFFWRARRCCEALFFFELRDEPTVDGDRPDFETLWRRVRSLRKKDLQVDKKLALRLERIPLLRQYGNQGSHFQRYATDMSEDARYIADTLHTVLKALLGKHLADPRASKSLRAAVEKIAKKGENAVAPASVVTATRSSLPQSSQSSDGRRALTSIAMAIVAAGAGALAMGAWSSRGSQRVQQEAPVNHTSASLAHAADPTAGDVSISAFVDASIGAHADTRDAGEEPRNARDAAETLACADGYALVSRREIAIGAPRDRPTWPSLLSFEPVRRTVGSFCLGARRVTGAELRARLPTALQANVGCRFGVDARAIGCITHAEATSYCASIGGRLPTVLEWESAARQRITSSDQDWEASGDAEPGEFEWAADSFPPDVFRMNAPRRAERGHVMSRQLRLVRRDGEQPWWSWTHASPDSRSTIRSFRCVLPPTRIAPGE